MFVLFLCQLCFYQISGWILFLFCTIVAAEEEGASKKREDASSATGAEEAKAEAGQAGGSSLRRACSLSDLNKPSVPRRILPAPPANGKTEPGSARYKIDLKCMKRFSIRTQPTLHFPLLDVRPNYQ